MAGLEILKLDSSIMRNISKNPGDMPSAHLRLKKSIEKTSNVLVILKQIFKIKYKENANIDTLKRQRLSLSEKINSLAGAEEKVGRNSRSCKYSVSFYRHILDELSEKYRKLNKSDLSGQKVH